MSIRSRVWEKCEAKTNCARPVALLITLLVTALLVAPIASKGQEQTAPPTAAPPTATPPPAQAAPEQTQVPGPEANSQAPQAEAQGAAPLRVLVGKSLLINTTERLKRISVTDDAIADALVVTPTQILVHGRAAGEVSLLIWDELERSRSFDLRVDVDVRAAAEEERRVFPDEQISVSPSRSAIVLSGHVSTEDVSKRAGMIAEAYSKNVVNVLTFGPVGAQEVLLEVKFAEVDRSAITQLGINLFAPGLGNTVALSQTGQFGSLTVTNQAATTTTSGNTTTTTTTATPPTVNISDFLNFFVTRTDVNIGAVIKALQQKNLLQILAEPNLIAVNGKEASFLAGGEFPFPLVQPGQGFTAVTISFKEFGVQLKFTPVIMPNGNIHLKVAPSVSTLDFANALTISGFTVPALSTRKAETEFELQDGQSFVIAGLIDNRVTDLYNKIPGLGDIPILGNFFKSKSAQKSNSELMVLCTARRVSPSTQPPAPPSNPQPFMDKDKFDNKKPSDSKK
ncbi:MAG TPA: type II and III secretion system protein family protein [Terriglobales bacterium]|jgi:pilus assembly protein CpaC|nr:type II and III secretion system protein family protein [Terriglobales bacterium]